MGGEVHGFADRSVIPTAMGFRPVMIISAVCEHIAAGLQAS